jgi:hypothetical protein
LLETVIGRHQYLERLGKYSHFDRYCAKSPGREVNLMGLREAKVMIENWRRHYKTVRRHGSLGYKPPPPDRCGPRGCRAELEIAQAAGQLISVQNRLWAADAGYIPTLSPGRRWN